MESVRSRVVERGDEKGSGREGIVRARACGPRVRAHASACVRPPTPGNRRWQLRASGLEPSAQTSGVCGQQRIRESGRAGMRGR